MIIFLVKLAVAIYFATGVILYLRAGHLHVFYAAMADGYMKRRGKPLLLSPRLIAVTLPAALATAVFDIAGWPLTIGAFSAILQWRAHRALRAPCRCMVCGEIAPKGMINCQTRVDAIMRDKPQPDPEAIEQHLTWHARHIHAGEPGSAYAEDGTLRQ